MRSFRLRTVSGLLAWLGLALMTGSFLELLRVPPRPAAVDHRGREARELFPLVIIDPGHGGQDSGAEASGIAEKELTLDLAQRMARLLQARGLSTKLTRSDDVYVSLSSRAALANRVARAIFVSIHCNDGSRPFASGVETYFAPRQPGGGLPIATWLPFLRQLGGTSPNLDSQSLAGFIQQELVTRTHASDRGTKCEQFYVLANVRHPAALVEAGFLTNKEDIARLSNANYREEVATAITKGILRYRAALPERAFPSGSPVSE